MRVSTSPLLALMTAAAATTLLAAGAAAPASLEGGTYRVGWGFTEFYWTDGFDPSGEQDVGAAGIYSNLLLRGLVGYEHVSGAAGMRPVADLAASLPAPTNEGRTYTFRLKPGLRFGPPVNRAIAAGDIRYALERLARHRAGSHYADYFEVVRGFHAYRARKAATIAGIATPDARTIRFELSRPVGDFLHRLALAAAAPIPREVARCFAGRPGYGRVLISSGPYMIEGADALRIDSCASMRPLHGLNETQLTLVRNPRYDPRTDSQAMRESNPDRFVFVAGGQDLAGNAAAIVRKLTAGELDDAYLVSSKQVIEKYAARAARRGALRVNAAGWTHYLTMNLTQPPFDDVHVRRALSWAVDRAELRAAFGGATAGPIATHIVPDELLGGRLKEFAPFATRGGHGDAERARAEMAKSRYATRDGVCTARACKGVWLVPLYEDVNYSAGTRMKPVVRAAGAKIGISFADHGRPYDRVGKPSYNLDLSPSTHLYEDYPDPASLVDRSFRGAFIRAEGNLNTSLVGIRPAQARRLGVEGRVDGVPSVDRDIARCSVLSGAARLDCYAALDRKLTTEIVPWIPYLWRNRITILGPQVARWEFDQATGLTAYAHVAVKG